MTPTAAIADKIKGDSKEAISLLKQAGIYTVLLTGDNEKTANSSEQRRIIR